MDRKWTYLLFAMGGLLLAYLLTKAGEWAWAFYGTKPNELMVDGLALVAAGLATVVAMKNERVFTLASECTTELRKVTWPTRKETGIATVVVIVTTLISSLFLGIFDQFWGWLTRVILNG